MVKEKNKMKTEYVKLNVAIKALSKEWSFVPKSSVLKALNAGLIPHAKSGQGQRATNFVRVEDLKKYYETLKR